ncbi:ABC-2 type transport system permease protein [Evansella caseinilytica]|uniref:ABC-2 type transport system permease protein n=1 Tax=Evansella caseinilytica TaxID=1503961 RepID=A0A1H3SS97_9BACI|nr:ABC transporter permease [Evansella caseinilytica]SDZ40973.1 ABC-2 type transport system permease protein [Evansella caseinilytica]
MKSVFLLQWRRLYRAPVMLVFLVLTIVFVSLLAGANSENKLTVYTFFDSALTDEGSDAWLEKLNEAELFEFREAQEEEARQAVFAGEINFAVQLMNDDYRLLVAADDPNRFLLENYVNQVFAEELRLREAEQQSSGGEIRTSVEKYMADPPLQAVTTSLEGEGSFKQEGQLQVLFGMSLFFSIYTVLFSLMNIAEEKRGGTWDRMIISPLRKWQVYLGHMTFCFIVGFAQIVLIFLFFHYVFGFDLGERYGTMAVILGCYTFAVVALGLLLMGLVKTPQQLQAVIPIVASAIAMLGGAFWPIEVVTNEIMLAVSKGMPIFYGIDALKGAALYDRGLSELLHPISMMMLFGVACMGIGINLMERR